ncbi:MAG: ATP-binding protein [Oscillospiraceae bacterium]|nr:ATP-binding protein [Oscillospiraceae bacterium]MBP3209309.1 ATP-binding protein [Oscillospiraceae bacterium]
MVNHIESIPEARLLLMSLRSVGYTEEAAIADIIDNSISADASEISISFDWADERIVIVDNGNGMTGEDLISNMRIGSADPGEIRPKKDLGRFGMGMKTAAFALGKRLTVITKTNGQYANAAWDLDEVLRIGWNLIIQNTEGLEQYNSLLEDQGTVVIIEKLDRMIDPQNKKKSEKKFYSTIRKTEDHLGLTFHRFIEEDGIQIFINGNKIDAWNPFLINNRATQELPEEMPVSDDGLHEAIIQPYILPHKTKFQNQDEYQKAGGPKGWNYHQGIYLYRNKRLIVYGTWFDYVKKEPAYNLARIKLDISSDSDELWGIDIKKSTASLPLYIKESMERSIDVATEASARVYNSRGTYTRNTTVPSLSYVWEQRKVNGRYSFHINKKHILLNSIRDQLDEQGKMSLSAYLSLVENYAPFMVSGVTDAMQKPQTVPQDSTEKTLELAEIKRHIELFRQKGFTEDEIRFTLLEMSNYKHLKAEILQLLGGQP